MFWGALSRGSCNAAGAANHWKLVFFSQVLHLESAHLGRFVQGSSWRRREQGGALAGSYREQNQRGLRGCQQNHLHGGTAAPHSSCIPPHAPTSLRIVRCCFGEEKLLLSCKQGMASRSQEITVGIRHPTALATAPEPDWQ